MIQIVREVAFPDPALQRSFARFSTSDLSYTFRGKLTGLEFIAWMKMTTGI